MSHSEFCRNPKYKARFSKISMSASRRIPALVNTAVLDAYYVANPANVNRSPDRVCTDCGHQKNDRPRTWLPDHLRVYASVKLGFTCLAFQSLFPQPRLCFSWLTFVFFVAMRRLASAASDTDGMYQEPGARNLYGPRCFFLYLVLFFMPHLVQLHRLFLDNIPKFPDKCAAVLFCWHLAFTDKNEHCHSVLRSKLEVFDAVQLAALELLPLVPIVMEFVQANARPRVPAQADAQHQYLSRVCVDPLPPSTLYYIFQIIFISAND